MGRKMMGNGNTLGTVRGSGTDAGIGRPAASRSGIWRWDWVRLLVLLVLVYAAGCASSQSAKEDIVERQCQIAHEAAKKGDWVKVLAAAKRVLRLDPNHAEGREWEWGALLDPLPEETDRGLKYKVHQGKVVVTGLGPGIVEELSLPATLNGKPVVRVGWQAFMSCPPLRSVTIPDGVTSIGFQAFMDCPALTSVTIPDSVTNIGFQAFMECEALRSVTIPDGVTSIGDWAFAFCEALTSVAIPDGVTSIGVAAFVGCEALTSVTIPDSVTSIGKGAFMECEALTSVTIPDSVTNIGGMAFNDCRKLAGILVDQENPSYVSADGVLFTRNMKELVQYPSGRETGGYAIPDSVTSIGVGAFASCEALTSATIPDGVTNIGVGAFEGCRALTSVTIPDGVTNIGDRAFLGCEALTSVTIPASVTNIGPYAFSECRRLRTVVLPKGVKLGQGVFKGCPWQPGK